MNPLLVGLVLYILAQLAIGVIVSRRVRSEDDYLVAGRSMGYTLSVFSIFATWFGAEACSDAAGTVYSNGISWTSTEPYAYGVAKRAGWVNVHMVHHGRSCLLLDPLRAAVVCGKSAGYVLCRGDFVL